MRGTCIASKQTHLARGRWPWLPMHAEINSPCFCPGGCKLAQAFPCTCAMASTDTSFSMHLCHGLNCHKLFHAHVPWLELSQAFPCICAMAWTVTSFSMHMCHGLNCHKLFHAFVPWLELSQAFPCICAMAQTHRWARTTSRPNSESTPVSDTCSNWDVVPVVDCTHLVSSSLSSWTSSSAQGTGRPWCLFVQRAPVCWRKLNTEGNVDWIRQTCKWAFRSSLCEIFVCIFSKYSGNMSKYVEEYVKKVKTIFTWSFLCFCLLAMLNPMSFIFRWSWTPVSFRQIALCFLRRTYHRNPTNNPLFSTKIQTRTGVQRKLPVCALQWVTVAEQVGHTRTVRTHCWGALLTVIMPHRRCLQGVASPFTQVYHAQPAASVKFNVAQRDTISQSCHSSCGRHEFSHFEQKVTGSHHLSTFKWSYFCSITISMLCISITILQKHDHFHVDSVTRSLSHPPLCVTDPLRRLCSPDFSTDARLN